MSRFAHYLLHLIAGEKRWHLPLFIVLLAQCVFAGWLVQQKHEPISRHIEQLFGLNRLSAPIAKHAVIISQLHLAGLEKLTLIIERYQQQLDLLRPYYEQNKSPVWQTFTQLNVIWQPLREAADDLFAQRDKLVQLRSAVEDTDKRLPAVVVELDRVIDNLRSTASKPATQRLLREQRLILHRLSANINAVTAGVLSAVNTNARSALSSSIESDLFLLEKSLGLIVAENHEELTEAEKQGSDVSALTKIDGVSDRLAALANGVRKVIESLPVINSINQSSQLLVEDSGLLIEPVQQLILHQKQLAQRLGAERLWFYTALIMLPFWLVYMGFLRLRQSRAEIGALKSESDSLQGSVDDVARQMANFSEGDHHTQVHAKAVACKHLAEQANRMIDYVTVLDKQIETDYQPLIKRVIKAESEMAASIDRQANDIARLSAELNNVVAGRTTGSATLTTHLTQTKAQLQTIVAQIESVKKELSGQGETQTADAIVHTVRQLQKHIEDRLQTLAELSQRINLDVVEMGASLAGRSVSERGLRRTVEQLQLLTGRYHDMVGDISQLLNDLNAGLTALLDKTERAGGFSEAIERLRSSVNTDVADIDQRCVTLASALASEDKAQAQHAERISLILDELQDTNQRLTVVAMDGDVGIKQLDKLASQHTKVLPRPSAEPEDDEEVAS